MAAPGCDSNCLEELELARMTREDLQLLLQLCTFCAPRGFGMPKKASGLDLEVHKFMLRTRIIGRRVEGGYFQRETPILSTNE